MRDETVLVLLIVLVTASAGAGYYIGASSERMTTSTTTSTTTSVEVSTSTATEVVTSYTLNYCTITGGPGPIYVRFLNSSTLAPVAGVYVVAATTVYYCSNGSSTGSQTVGIFTTNGTEWYQLPTVNDFSYSITAFYSGHLYNFTAETQVMSTACATLYIPSGQTNVTLSAPGRPCIA